MAKTADQMMEMMVEPVREHCPEPVHTAMVLSHAGSMGAAFRTAMQVGFGLTKTSDLPNPVLVAVGETMVYAFKFKPRGFKLKVKKNGEVGRWQRDRVWVRPGSGGRINSFTLVIDGAECDFEVTTMGRENAVEMLDRFFDSIGRLPAQ